jgi:hypothetical protein
MEYNNCLGYPNYDFVNDPLAALTNLFTSEWVKKVDKPNVD